MVSFFLVFEIFRFTVVGDSVKDKSFFLFHLNEMQCVNTFENIHKILKKQTKHENIKAIQFCKLNTKGDFIKFTLAEQRKLSKTVETLIKQYPNLSKVSFKQSDLGITEEGKSLEKLLYNRQKYGNTSELLEALEKGFELVENESIDGFRCLSEAQGMKILNIPKEAFMKVIVYGIENKTFKIGEKDGQEVICYLKGRRIEFTSSI